MGFNSGFKGLKFVNSTSLGTALPVSSPWFHQEVTALMVLIWLIYLFIYFLMDLI